MKTGRGFGATVSASVTAETQEWLRERAYRARSTISCIIRDMLEAAQREDAAVQAEAVQERLDEERAAQAVQEVGDGRS